MEEMSMLTREDVQKILSDQIEPRLAMDGGGIELVDLTQDGVVKVRLRGACSGCPGARMTLQMGVERILKEALPDVKSVQAV
jgi:Fe-S cluster biogenesis protein NfuA